MMILITGGSGSGKSAYAEKILEQFSDVEHRYYLAAMEVFDEEGQRKVERHKQLRQGKGFLTIEQPRNIETAAEGMAPGPRAALLECMSNLTANEMFGGEGSSGEDVQKRILEGIRRLKKDVTHLVLVTNNVFEDGIRYADRTMEYLKTLSAINRELAREADRVVEVVAGLPLVIKDGGKDA